MVRRITTKMPCTGFPSERAKRFFSCSSYELVPLPSARRALPVVPMPAPASQPYRQFGAVMKSSPHACRSRPRTSSQAAQTVCLCMIGAESECTLLPPIGCFRGLLPSRRRRRSVIYSTRRTWSRYPAWVWLSGPVTVTRSGCGRWDERRSVLYAAASFSWTGSGDAAPGSH